MVFLFVVCEKIPVCNVFFYLMFSFIPNTMAIYKNKILPSSEPEIVSKEFENSHLNSFNVNLRDVFKIIVKYCPYVISKYRQKSSFIG